MLKLEEIIPECPSFYLRRTDMHHKLRPITLEDEIWLRQEYGDKLPTLFNEEYIDEEALVRIVYRLLLDKTPFVAQEITVIDEDGKEYKETLGGIKLLHRLIIGMSEKIDMLQALGIVMELSRPSASDVKGTSGKKKEAMK